MALNVASLLKATGDLAKSDPLGDIREQRGQDQVRQAQLATAETGRASNVASTKLKNQQFDENEAAALQLRTDIAQVEPYRAIRHLYGKEFLLSKERRNNAFDETIKEGNAYLSLHGPDTPASKQWKLYMDGIADIRAKRGTPEQAAALDHYRGLMNAGKQGYALLAKNNVSGYFDEKDKKSTFKNFAKRGADGNLTDQRMIDVDSQAGQEMLSSGEWLETGNATNPKNDTKSLAPGSRLVDSDGKVILQAQFKPELAQKMTATQQENLVNLSTNTGSAQEANSLLEGMGVEFRFNASTFEVMRQALAAAKDPDNTKTTEEDLEVLSGPLPDITEGLDVISLGTGAFDRLVGGARGVQGLATVSDFVGGEDKRKSANTLRNHAQLARSAFEAVSTSKDVGTKEKINAIIDGLEGGSFTSEDGLADDIESLVKTFIPLREAARQRIEIAKVGSVERRTPIKEFNHLDKVIQGYQQILKAYGRETGNASGTTPTDAMSDAAKRVAKYKNTGQ